MGFTIYCLDCNLGPNIAPFSSQLKIQTPPKTWVVEMVLDYILGFCWVWPMVGDSHFSPSPPFCFHCHSTSTCIAQVIPQRPQRRSIRDASSFHSIQFPKFRCFLLCALRLESLLPPSFILLPRPPMAKKYAMANAPLSEFGVLVAQLESIVTSASQQPPEALLCFDLLSDLISAIDEEPKVPLARFSFHFCPTLFFSFFLTRTFTPYLHSYELGFDLVYV